MVLLVIVVVVVVVVVIVVVVSTNAEPRRTRERRKGRGQRACSSWEVRPQDVWRLGGREKGRRRRLFPSLSSVVVA